MLKEASVFLRHYHAHVIVRNYLFYTHCLNHLDIKSSDDLIIGLYDSVLFPQISTVPYSTQSVHGKP